MYKPNFLQYLTSMLCNLIIKGTKKETHIDLINACLLINKKLLLETTHKVFINVDADAHAHPHRLTHVILFVHSEYSISTFYILPRTKGKIGSSRGLSGRPTVMSFPFIFKRPSKGAKGWTAAIVSIIKSMVPTAACSEMNITKSTGWLI